MEKRLIYSQAKEPFFYLGTGSIELCAPYAPCGARHVLSCFAQQDLNPISRKLIDRGKFKELRCEAFEFLIRQKSNARGSLD